MCRPKDWIKKRSIFFNTHQPRKPYYKSRQIDYEAGADALWKSVCDYIAELSKDSKDDKLFRVKLFLWLTKEER